MTVSSTNSYQPLRESPLLPPRKPRGRPGDIGRIAFYVITAKPEHRDEYVRALYRAIEIAPPDDKLRTVFRPFLSHPLPVLEQFTLNNKKHFEEFEPAWWPPRDFEQEREARYREIIMQTVNQHYFYDN